MERAFTITESPTVRYYRLSRGSYMELDFIPSSDQANKKERFCSDPRNELHKAV